MSIDFLLSYDIKNTSRDGFINRLKKSIKNKINDVYSLVVQIYIVYGKYDLAIEYIEENNIYDNRSLAECMYRLRKYDEAYELTTWVITLIDSISKTINAYVGKKIVYLFLRALCEKLLAINNESTINKMKVLLTK